MCVCGKYLQEVISPCQVQLNMTKKKSPYHCSVFVVCRSAICYRECEMVMMDRCRASAVLVEWLYSTGKHYIKTGTFSIKIRNLISRSCQCSCVHAELIFTVLVRYGNFQFYVPC